jgi:hypothetical protein
MEDIHEGLGILVVPGRGLAIDHRADLTLDASDVKPHRRPLAERVSGD